MKNVLAMFVLAMNCFAGESATAASLKIQGTVCKVTVEGDIVTVSFKGIGQLAPNDPAFTNRRQPIALYGTSVRLKLSRSMESYSKFRYLNDVNREEAIALMKRFRDESTEMQLYITVDRILHSKPQGFLRISTITGTLHAISPWKSLFKESIAERLNKFGVDYNVVMGQEDDADDIGG